MKTKYEKDDEEEGGEDRENIVNRWVGGNRPW